MINETNQALAIVKPAEHIHSNLAGAFVRIIEIDHDKQQAKVKGSESLKKAYGTNKFYIKQENLQLLTTGSLFLGSEIKLNLGIWAHLNHEEKLAAVRYTIKRGKADYFEDFESYIGKEQSINLLDAFIEKTIERMTTHNHYGSKAIFEDLRWHSELIDGCTLFKVNNNYTASLSRLVEEMFPETIGFFFKRGLTVVGSAA